MSGRTNSIALYKVNCPSHQDDTASLAVYSDGHGYCYGCSTYFPDYAKPEFHVEVQEEAVRQNALPPLPWALVEGYCEVLHGEFSNRKQWLYRRGLTPSTIREYHLGHNGIAFTIPIFNDDGHVLGIKFRRDEELDPDGNVDPKYWGLKGYSKVQLYGTWQDLTDKEVILCEGELDALRLLQEMGQGRFSILSSTGGAGGFNNDLAEALASVRNILLAFDQDEPGLQGATRAAHLLRAQKVETHIIQWDPAWGGKDITDLLNRRGLKGFQECVAHVTN